MKRRTVLLGGVSAVVGGSTLLGSGALSETDSQRVVHIEVAGDDEAYLRLAYDSQSVECEDTAVLATLTNHLKAPLTDIDVSYSVTNDDVTVTGLSVPDSLAVGESGDATVEVACESDTEATATVRFDVEVRNDDHEVTVQDRKIEVACSCPAEEDDQSGEGNGENGRDGGAGGGENGDGNRGEGGGGENGDGNREGTGGGNGSGGERETGGRGEGAGDDGEG